MQTRHTRVELEDLAERVSIPTLPEVVRRLNSMVEDPKVGLEEIGAVVAQDAPIASKVLRIANSAIYGLKEPASSVLGAATVVGARTLRNIALQASVVQHYESIALVHDFDLEMLWRHAVFVGQLAQELSIRSPEIRGMPPDEFYTCGLLHDIGKVVLLETLGEEYLDAYRIARDSGRPLHQVEEETFGYSHAAVGAAVAARWQLHQSIATVIEYHHGPRSYIENYPFVMVVAVADQVAYRLETSTFERSARKLAALSAHLLRMGPKEFGDFVAWATEIYPLIEI